MVILTRGLQVEYHWFNTFSHLWLHKTYILLHASFERFQCRSFESVFEEIVYNVFCFQNHY
jgi:hypothetical protein